MEKIKHFLLSENTNSLYEKEAISSIGLTREVADKINEIVDACNALSEGDLEWKQTQEGIIRKGVLFMKDNLVNSLQDLFDLMERKGFIKDRISAYTEALEGRLDNLLKQLNEGTTNSDAEVIDARFGDDGEEYPTLGEAMRNQFHNLNPFLFLYQGVNFNSETGEITLETNANGQIMFNTINRKGSGVEVASFDGNSVFYDKSITRPVAVALNIAGDTASLKLEATNTYFPDSKDIILFYIYYGKIVPVSLAPQSINVDGIPYAENPSAFKKYPGSMVGLNAKLRVDQERMKITLESGYYVLPMYKTGIVLMDETTIDFQYLGVIEYVVYNAKTQELYIKDRFHQFLNDEYCLGTLYAGNFIPVEMADFSVSFTNNEKPIIIENEKFITINDCFRSLSNPNHKTKIVLVGDSITHGTGGTGFAQNGDLMIKVGTREYRRSPNSYSWGNLFKEYIESNYNAEVINNGCTGTNAEWWNGYKGKLIPSDTDIVVLTLGTNDRSNGSTKTEVINKFYTNLSSIVKYCHGKGIHIVLCSPIPASVSNEQTEDRFAHNFEMNAVIQRVAADYNMEYANLYNSLCYEIMEKELDLDSLLPDGLHPSDEMYKKMFFHYLKLFNLAPVYSVLSNERSFYFDQRGNYSFKKGMTWAEFINSNYNIIYNEDDDSAYTFHVNFTDSSLVAWYGMMISLNGSSVKLTDKIVEGGSYTLL